MKIIHYILRLIFNQTIKKNPSQWNYVQGVEEEEDEDSAIETNHFFTTNGMPIFVTEDEEYAESSNNKA